MAKWCCYKANARRGKTSSTEQPSHEDAHRQITHHEADARSKGSIERHTTASSHDAFVIATSPRSLPPTQTQPAAQPVTSSNVDMSTSRTTSYAPAVSSSSHSPEPSTSRLHQRMSQESSSSVDGHCPRPVIYGMTDDNRDAYAETLRMLEEAPAWACGHESANPPSKVLYKMDPGNKSGWIYLALVLPAPLVASLAPTAEIDTWPKWHPTCVKHEMTGDASTWHCQTHFEQSMAFGAFKSDQNTRVQRWLNQTEGFFLQRVTTLKPGDIGYVKPRLHRDQIEAAWLTASLSPNETLFLQLFRIETPLPIPHFIQKIFLGTIAPQIIKQLITNARSAEDPKFPYKERIAADAYGLYAYLHKMALADSPKPRTIIAKTDKFLGKKQSRSADTLP